MPDPSPRERTHRWEDPISMAQTTRSLSGREYFAAWTRGELVPPMAATLGFELVSFNDGAVVIECQVDEFHFSPYGMVHGGLTAVLLDTATGCAVHTRLPAGTGYATLNLNVSFIRPVTLESGRLRCSGRVESMGRRVAVAEAELSDAEGRSLARASSTCMILEPAAGS